MFNEAVKTVDHIGWQENQLLQNFKTQTERREQIARDNLVYLDANGFMAFNPYVENFLKSLNRNMLSVYPQADGEIILPKEFSERDRALLAHGLIMSMGSDIKITDYFEIPGYRLKKSDASGEINQERIKSKLEASQVLKAGEFHENNLESRFINNK